MKKFVNEPPDFVREMLDGLVHSNGDKATAREVRHYAKIGLMRATVEMTVARSVSWPVSI